MWQMNPTQPARPVWTLADRLVKARNHANVSQDELAQRLQVGIRTIRRYEAGGATKRGVLLAWALATNVDVTWLLFGDDGPTNGGVTTDAPEGPTVGKHSKSGADNRRFLKAVA